MNSAALLFKVSIPQTTRMLATSSCRIASTRNFSISSVDKACPALHRKSVWFHHIKSSKKKKHIADWGKELKLGGFCKPGFPGVLILEGHEENVTDFLKRLKRLRWQHVQVRGEEEEYLHSEDQSLDSLRRFPLGIQELPESGMSELAEMCREANLEKLFLTALKISR